MTSSFVPASRSYGYETSIDHVDRDVRADEFMEVATALCDSCSDNVISDERESGQYTNDDRIRPVEHRGEYYSVVGRAAVKPWTLMSLV